MLTRLSLCLAILSLGLVLAACRGPAAPTAAASDQLSTPVTFARSGGIAGIRERIEVGVDGAYTITHNDGSAENGQLTPAQIQELASLLSASGLFDADHSFETPGADLFIYTITSNGHTVTAMDGAIPEELTGVIDFFSSRL